MPAHKGTQSLVTDRLILRKYFLSDANDMFNNFASDSRVTRFLSWTPYEDVKAVRQFLWSVIDNYSQDTFYHWAIEFDGQVIGGISVTNMDQQNNSCEIGYCIGYDFWTKGITTEALEAVIKFLFNEVGMHRIVAKHDVENPASGLVMQKCHMIFEGTLRKHYLRHDHTYSDCRIYAILRDDQTSQKN